VTSVFICQSADPERLPDIKARMSGPCGPPRILVFALADGDSPDLFIAAEDGANRLTAAHELGVPPTLLVIRDQHFGLPWSEVPRCRPLVGDPELCGTIGEVRKSLLERIEDEDDLPVLAFPEVRIEDWNP
jgi:hypothetical protein